MEGSTPRTKIPRKVPTSLLLEWAERNRLIYVRMIEEAKLGNYQVEAAYYRGASDMNAELIHILTNLKDYGVTNG